MPARSEKQRRAAGSALAAKTGKQDPNSLKGPSKKMYASMTQEELEEMASK